MKIEFKAENKKIGGDIEYTIWQNGKKMMTFTEHQHKEAIRCYLQYLKDWRLTPVGKYTATIS